MRIRDLGLRLEAGFTLVELMVVMVILGILAAMVGGNFQSSQIKGRDAQRKSDLGQVKLALEAYVNDYGVYPAANVSGEIMACDDPVVACPWGEAMQDGNNTVYMIKLPSDRQAPSRQFTYRTNATQTSYWILTSLENTRDQDWNEAVEDFEITCGIEICNFGVSSANTTIEQADEGGE